MGIIKYYVREASLYSNYMCTITIDTSKSHEVTVILEVKNKKFIKNKNHEIHSSQLVLPLIDQLLGEHSLKVSDISKIYVQTGPGSFTGLRVGAAVAQTLGFALNVPVNDEEASKPLTLVYENDAWDDRN